MEAVSSNAQRINDLRLLAVGSLASKTLPERCTHRKCRVKRQFSAGECVWACWMWMPEYPFQYEKQNSTRVPPGSGDQMVCVETAVRHLQK